jgi:hypothetical protein
MADSVICDEIQAALENGPIKVKTHNEFRYKAKIHGSADAVKLALGSLIKRGVVRRHRPAPEGCSDQKYPITFELSYR